MVQEVMDPPKNSIDGFVVVPVLPPAFHNASVVSMDKDIVANAQGLWGKLILKVLLNMHGAAYHTILVCHGGHECVISSICEWLIGIIFSTLAGLSVTIISSKSQVNPI